MKRIWFVVLVWTGMWSPGTLADDNIMATRPAYLRDSVGDLAKAARQWGDAQRGAALFFQPTLSCAKCHDAEVGTQFGPDLSKLGKEATPEHLIESLLTPSKQIRKGYETHILLTRDGKTITGLKVEANPNNLTLLDPSAGGKQIIIPTSEIESQKVVSQSLMPEGLANLLSDRQQFLDLIAYLIDIGQGGPERVKQLRPAITKLIIPDYEQQIDHAALINAWNNKSYRRGEAIYQRVCANCHGTIDQAGSLPTSPRFANHVFKNGSDPHSLYQTLTRGYGFMPAQSWMVPKQKYDVIQYLRETYLKKHNPSKYAKVDERYLAGLPKGTTLGPDPIKVEPWVTMDYGPSLMNTYEIGAGPNIAYKAIAIRLDGGAGGVSRGTRFAMFDHDTLRFAAAWSGPGFIDWRGIHFDGQHQVHPKVVGDVAITNPIGPGWANSETGRFDDPRLVGRDGRRYGPLPRSWGRFKGTYQFGDQTVVSYEVGGVAILESYEMEATKAGQTDVIFARNLEIGPSGKELLARIAPIEHAVSLVADTSMSLVTQDGSHCLKIPPATATRRAKLLLAKSGDLTTLAKQSTSPKSLSVLTKGGPKRWSESLTTKVTIGDESGSFAVDTLGIPDKNPWNAQLRLTGFDFTPDGKQMFVCAWDGDVWRVSGLDRLQDGLTWHRIASGLFQPLGLKIVNDQILVCCRDQIVKLHDLNQDGEMDFYECFNNDHQVTEHFHEFAMGLQADEHGNLYYAKSGRHALKAIVPHHGTLLKVSSNGAQTEILATGFRAANGVCLNPDGTFFVTDQEGFWTPKNRINLVERGGFYGNLWGYTDITDTSDSAMKQPLCWITNEFDRSPAELVWVNSKAWGALNGSLLNISYGHGKIYVVLSEKINGQAQGGMCALPIPTFPTGIMRGRFHPTDGQLYTCGMFAWAGNQTQAGGFYRVRATAKPANLPVNLAAKKGKLVLTFTDPIDPTGELGPDSFQVKAWDLKRTQNYGSKHLNEHALPVEGVSLSADLKAITLSLPTLAPTWGMEIKYRVRAKNNQMVSGTIHNTIHQLAD